MFFWKKNLPFFYATFQCGRYGVFKKIKKNFFDPEKVKKRASKVAHNRPRPFYFTIQPRPTAHSPQLIFHIMKSWDKTSVLLSVGRWSVKRWQFVVIFNRVFSTWKTFQVQKTVHGSHNRYQKYWIGPGSYGSAPN